MFEKERVMGMFDCEECGKPVISSTGDNCPSCGAYIKMKQKMTEEEWESHQKWQKWGDRFSVGFFVVLVIICVLVALGF